MKLQLLKSLKTYLFLPLFVLFLFASCQDEVADITDNNTEDTFDNTSALAQSIFNTVTYDGSFDNVLDSANCISVNLPVTIEVNGITITIESIEDYDVLEDILDEFDDDDDIIEIQYPITITLSNYEQIVINNEEELFAFVDECLGENEEDDDIECIDFQYPISISVFDANFDVIDTIEINSDEELYEFIDDLEGGVLASINFPVTMILADGSTVVVNNNDELQAAIDAAEDACDEDDDYDYNDDECDNEESIELALKECLWEISDFNGDDVFDDYYIDFDPNYGFVVTNPNGNVVHDGTWSVSELEGDFTLTFDTDWQDLSGEWTIVECDGDEFYLQNGDITMEIEQECDVNTDPLSCLQTNTIELCDENNDGVEVFNLYEGLSEIPDCEVNNTVSVSYHESLADAETNTNPIMDATAYTNISNPQTIYVRVELSNNPSQFDILEMNLILEDCSSTCTAAQVNEYLMDCKWEVANLNGSDDLAYFNLYFSENDDLSALNPNDGNTYSGFWNVTETDNGGVLLELANISGPNIQAISGYWDLVECEPDRLQFTNDNNEVLVLEQQECYTVEQLFNTISDCSWEVQSFTDDLGNVLTSDYDGFIYTFFENEFVYVENGASIGYGGMESEATGTNELIVLLQFFNVSAGIGNYYFVESISDTEIVFIGAGVGTELVLARNCDHNNQDGDTEQIKDWLYQGNWEITYSTMDNQDNSVDYDGIAFNFENDATLLGDNGSWIAEIGYDVLRDVSGDLRFVINYLGQFPYWQMDDDWYITEVNENRIELHHVNDDTNNEFVLVFEKIQ